jgi:hypothetical protein
MTTLSHIVIRPWNKATQPLVLRDEGLSITR